MILLQFVKAHGITLASAVPIPSNPNLTDTTGLDRHFECTLSMGDKQFTLFVSTTKTSREILSADRVLDPLATIVVHQTKHPTYAEWAKDLGYKGADGQTTFDTITREAERLKEFLGTELFYELCTQVIL